MSILQALLNLGLVAIGSEDSRFAKVEAAAAALVDHLRSNPTHIIPATLIAIDREVDEDDPILTLVDEQLVNEWKTIRNTHVDKPRELLRSIILQALSLLGTGDPAMAAIIWQTAVSPTNHGQAKLGKERDLVDTLLRDFQKRAENEVTARISLFKPSLSEAQDRPTLQSDALLEDEDLSTDVGRAAGPHDRSGTAFETPNPQWPNSGPEWSYEFTPRMTEALVKAVNLGMNRLLDGIDTQLQSYQSELEQRLNSHLETGGLAVAYRLDVLWWSEAKYSPSLRLGYREMHRAVAAVSMAHDLSMLVPAMAPASVTYVLGETVAAVSQCESRSESWSVERLLEALHANGSDLRGIMPNTKGISGRIPLLRVVTAAIAGERVERADVNPRTGIDPGLEVSLSDFSMWMFRDLQARRLVEELG